MGPGHELDDSRRNERSESQGWIAIARKGPSLWGSSVVLLGGQIGVGMSWVRARLPPMKGHLQRPPGLACVLVETLSLPPASCSERPRGLPPLAPAVPGFLFSSVSETRAFGSLALS